MKNIFYLIENLMKKSQAFVMDREEFKEKYGFEKPDVEDKNVVLSCRCVSNACQSC